jgi:hypothetical protein
MRILKTKKNPSHSTPYLKTLAEQAREMRARARKSS